MKKLTTISLIIFCIITTAILTAGLVFYQENKINAPVLNNSALINSSSSGLSGSSVIGVNSIPSITLNLAEVAKHNSAGDCWMIINNKVYNMTSYLSIHPGGPGTITPYCGKEATAAFDTKGGRGNSHSSYADSLLAAYFVGNLNQAITEQQIQTNVQNTNTVAPSARSRGNNEFDD